MTHDAPVTWMPIETAPKDGTFILLHEILAQPPVSVGCYDHECGWLIAEADFMPSKCIPRHWMPLPAAPVDDRVSTSSPVDDRAAPETSGKLRDAELDDARSAKDELRRLMDSIWRAEYMSDAPLWRPLDDLVGMVTQIDNMYAGVRSQRDELQAELAKFKALAETLAGGLEKIALGFTIELDDEDGPVNVWLDAEELSDLAREALRQYEETRDDKA